MEYLVEPRFTDEDIGFNRDCGIRICNECTRECTIYVPCQEQCAGKCADNCFGQCYRITPLRLPE